MTELRKTYGEQFSKRHNLKLGFMSAFVKAAAYALQDQPVVNASMKLAPSLSLILFFTKFYIPEFFKQLREMKLSIVITSI